MIDRIRRSSGTMNRLSVFLMQKTRVNLLTVASHHHRPPLVSSRPFSTNRFPADTSVLFLSNLHPEPNASAAGVRTAFLLEKLATSAGITSVHYACGSSASKATADTNTILERMGVHFHVLPPNRSDLAKGFFQKFATTTNMLVILDRFYAEEMYSFHIHKHCPQAVTVLDMQDMHSLRHARQHVIQTRDKLQAQSLDHLPLTERPSIDDSRLLRELASIYRSDLTIACSPAEMDLLRDHYQVPPEKLHVAPLFGSSNSSSAAKMSLVPNNSSKRRDFVFVGGFRHDPNVDAVRQLKRLWPLIRAKLQDSNVCVHIYGAYCPNQLQQQLHDPEQGFLVHGYHPSLSDILIYKRVMLAPLRFGAGIKGKIVDAWRHGLPVVTTPIGSEGMLLDGDDWGGRVAMNDDDFVNAAIDLYQNTDHWNMAQKQATVLLSQLYDDASQWDELAIRLLQALENRQERRSKDFTRAILWLQSSRSTEFFSKYIEYKEQHERSDRQLIVPVVDKE
jgi:glycosyltransferase involved in cell wall biosynthesis